MTDVKVEYKTVTEIDSMGFPYKTQIPVIRLEQHQAVLAAKDEELAKLREKHDQFFRYQCPLAQPSCLMCGQVKEFAIKHLELGAIGICRDCISFKQELARVKAYRDRVWASHRLYETTDADKPADSNGEVVLGLCRDCGRGEVQLEEPCDKRTQLDTLLGEAVWAIELIQFICFEGSTEFARATAFLSRPDVQAWQARMDGTV